MSVGWSRGAAVPRGSGAAVPRCHGAPLGDGGRGGEGCVVRKRPVWACLRHVTVRICIRTALLLQLTCVSRGLTDLETVRAAGLAARSSWQACLELKAGSLLAAHRLQLIAPSI